jgi:hypothetical protein
MDTYERRCRLLLRAYPPRYRRERGDELLGTLLDLAGDRRTPSMRNCADVIRGGLVTRWRGRPSWESWYLYRAFDIPLPAASRMWARDDIGGRWYPLRRFLSRLPIWALVVVVAVYGGLSFRVGSLVVAGVLVTEMALVGRRRRTMLARHGYRTGHTPGDTADRPADRAPANDDPIRPPNRR